MQMEDQIDHRKTQSLKLLILIVWLVVMTGCTDGSEGTQHNDSPPPNTVCGDGVVEGSEQCDDGNTTDGDGCSAACVSEASDPGELVDIPLHSEITKVQPMTGIVLWADSHNNSSFKTRDDVIQLEYAYMRPSDIVVGKSQYQWAPLDILLEEIRLRGKQAIIRWYYVYPGNTKTAVPAYIKLDPAYHETVDRSEGRDTAYPDWSHPELQQAHLDFYRAFAQRYDDDSRIAFLQVGFGLWGEYHIYDPGIQIGITYMIGNDQPAYQTIDRIKAVGIANGYKFTVVAFRASASQSQITIRNTGIAPIYYDAYPATNGVRASISLKGLGPNETREFSVNSGGANPTLTIECDRLVEGQAIEYEAEL